MTHTPTPPRSASPAGQQEEDEAAVALDAVSKTYGTGDAAVSALREVSMTLPQQTFTAIMGPSGSGKSTFLHCAAGLDRPSAGSVLLGGIDITGMPENKLTAFRRKHIGFVFQSFNLLNSLTARQNITLPFLLDGSRPDRAWLQEVIDRIGLAERMTHFPAELSGGQQQRISIARALVTKPRVIFADEPTGALDSRSGRDILQLLREAVDVLGQTLVMVTHDPRAAAHADRVVFLADGRIVEEMRSPTAERVGAWLSRLEG